MFLSIIKRLYNTNNSCLYYATKIKYNRNNKMLTICFNNNNEYSYLAEYLRVFSPAASPHSLQEHNIPFAPKKLIPQRKNISIIDIERIGSYAIALHFDDMHSEGIYSWDLLYDLGKNKYRNMKAYIKLLKYYKKSRNRPKLKK